VGPWSPLDLLGVALAAWVALLSIPLLGALHRSPD
jgi:hypothetical protein